MDNDGLSIPIPEKYLLTCREAAAYFNIGINRIRTMTNGDDCPYVLWIGSKRLIKRKPFEEYLYSSFSL